MKSGRTEHEEAAPTGAASFAYLGQLWGGWADTWDHPRSSRYLPLTSRYMREIPSIDELAEVIGQDENNVRAGGGGHSTRCAHEGEQHSYQNSNHGRITFTTIIRDRRERIVNLRMVRKFHSSWCVRVPERQADRRQAFRTNLSGSRCCRSRRVFRAWKAR